MGSLPQAIQEYSQALSLAKSISYWRGLTQAGGSLAQSYEREGNLAQALNAINEAIEANRKIPDELYFAPRNLAIKADPRLDGPA
jgi:tetratricopeptide (TPR) repeat protein